MKQLTDFFRDKPIRDILDVATGSGQFINALMRIFPDARFTGVDPDKESLQKAREKFAGKNVRFLQMGAEKLEFKPGWFDLVSISNGLHHLPQMKTSLVEMKRVLKPDGWLVISEHISDNLNPAQENQKFYHHLKSYADRLNGTFHHKTWTRQEILGMIQQNGIRIFLRFDYNNNRSQINKTEDIDFWVNRLKAITDTLKDNPVYPELVQRIGEFRQRIEKDGLQPVTNIVVVGKFLPDS